MTQHTMFLFLAWLAGRFISVSEKEYLTEISLSATLSEKY